MVASYMDSAMHYEKFKRRDAERKVEHDQQVIEAMEEKLKYF